MATEVKRLYRSRTDRVLLGVCGGLGEYLNIDPTVVRVLFVLAAIFGGPGLLVYLILMFIVPEEPLVAPAPHSESEATSEPAEA